MTRVHADAHGGVPAHLAYGGVPSSPSRYAGTPADAVRLPSYADYEGAPICHGVNLEKRIPCAAPPMEGGEFCYGHQRSEDKKNKTTK